MGLTAERLRELLDYDPATGVFTWRAKSSIKSRIQVGDVAGHKRSDGYVAVWIGGKVRKAHRLAWLHFYGEWPERDLDHIDGCRSHNAISNLRLATDSESRQNLHGVPSNSRSGVIGVCWYKAGQKWISHLRLNGKRVHQSYHDTFEAACAARRVAEVEHFRKEQ